MAWYAVKVSQPGEEIVNDQIRALRESEAEHVIRMMGYELHAIRILRCKTVVSNLCTWFVRLVGLERYVMRRYAAKCAARNFPDDVRSWKDLMDEI